MIAMRDWNSYLKKTYESPKVLGSIQTLVIKQQVFTVNDIEFGVEHLAKEKVKDNKGYQVEVLKTGGFVLIIHIHKIFKTVVKHEFPKAQTQSLIVFTFKIGDRNNLSNYRTIIISHVLTKLHEIYLEKEIGIWLGSQGKMAKDKLVLEAIVQSWTTQLFLGSSLRNTEIIKEIACVASLTLGNILMCSAQK